MGHSEVSTLLWQEREALQLLLFKLTEEKLVVSAGLTRWLPQANTEVEQALEQVRAAEVLLAAEVEVLAAGLGLSGLPTLSSLADAAPEPWSTLYSDHRQALLQLAAQVREATDDNRVLLTAGARSVRDTLLAITDSVDTYGADGSARSSSAGPMIMDEQA